MLYHAKNHVVGSSGTIPIAFIFLSKILVSDLEK